MGVRPAMREVIRERHAVELMRHVREGQEGVDRDREVQAGRGLHVEQDRCRADLAADSSPLRSSFTTAAKSRRRRRRPPRPGAIPEERPRPAPTRPTPQRRHCRVGRGRAPLRARRGNRHPRRRRLGRPWHRGRARKAPDGSHETTQHAGRHVTSSRPASTDVIAS